MKPMDLAGNNVLVVGLGRSALGAVRLLLREGAAPFVTDMGSAAALTPWCEALDQLDVPYETGGHAVAETRDIDLVVVSPGVPPAIPLLCTLREKGCTVIGELELGSRFCSSRILAVTGTNGKTTTTELLRTMIEACGHRVGLAGNNDMPLSAAVLEEPAPEYMVVEVSSYQLETVDTFKPWIGAVLNLTPDHLGRHGDMDTYGAVKAGLFSRQSQGDSAIVNRDDAYTHSMKCPEGVQRIEFSISGTLAQGMDVVGDTIVFDGQPVASVDDNPLPGKHNLANVVAALAMMRAGAFAWEHVLEGLRAFRAVEHRIEFVDTIDAVPWYNDSKSTNIDSLRVALDSFQAPIVLIVGGRGKGSEYSVLKPLMRAHVKAMVTLGEDAPVLEAAFGPEVPFVRADSMEDAVAKAYEQSAAGDVVLLSPGCASFDMYANFEARGHDFKRCVNRLKGRLAS